MPLLPIERRNARWWHMTNAALRLAVLRGATPWARNVIVNEYPKSGGSWFSQMLSEALELPFPRNRLPMATSCLMQCHVLNPAGMRRVVVVWRDGRDVMVSFYHHLLFGHEYADPEAPRRLADRLGIDDPGDIRAGLPRLIEALMEGRVGPSFSWPAFVHTWHDRPGVLETRYEDLLRDAEGELTRVTHALSGAAPDPARMKDIVARYSFRAQSKRDTGEEARGQFLRKGVAGDWVNHFSPEALSLFDHYAGDAMAALGYDRAGTQGDTEEAP